jgi:hypothetical protein
VDELGFSLDIIPEIWTGALDQMKKRMRFCSRMVIHFHDFPIIICFVILNLLQTIAISGMD